MSVKKEFKDLKPKQKEMIAGKLYSIAKEEYKATSKIDKDTIVDNLLQETDKRNIAIERGEIEKYYDIKISKVKARIVKESHSLEKPELDAKENERVNELIYKTLQIYYEKNHKVPGSDENNQIMNEILLKLKEEHIDYTSDAFKRKYYLKITSYLKYIEQGRSYKPYKKKNHRGEYK